MRFILYPLSIILLCLIAIAAPETPAMGSTSGWYATVTNAPGQDDGLPLGLVAWRPGWDSVMVAQVGVGGYYTHWKAIKKTFRVASAPIVLGGAVNIEIEPGSPPADQLLQAYGVEYLNGIGRDMGYLRRCMARWKASPQLPWPPI